MSGNLSSAPKRHNRWRRRLSVAGGLIIVGGVTYCASLYATAEKRVSQVCEQLLPGMDFDTVANIAAAHGMNGPTRGSTTYVVESATFGRHGCKLQFNDDLLQSSAYEFHD